MAYYFISNNSIVLYFSRLSLERKHLLIKGCTVALVSHKAIVRLHKAQVIVAVILSSSLSSV